jgi:hypothetical protein
VPSFSSFGKTTKSHAHLAEQYLKDHMSARKVSIMQNVRTLFVAITAAAVFAALALLTFSLTFAIGGILTVLMAARAISLRLKPAPIHAKAKAGRQPEMRIWNDGRGTIIDL